MDGGRIHKREVIVSIHCNYYQNRCLQVPGTVYPSEAPESTPGV